MFKKKEVPQNINLLRAEVVWAQGKQTFAPQLFRLKLKPPFFSTFPQLC